MARKRRLYGPACSRAERCSEDDDDVVVLREGMGVFGCEEG